MIKKKVAINKINISNDNADDNFLKMNATHFVGKLYNSKCISRTAVQSIIKDSSELVQDMTTQINKKLKASLPQQYHSDIDNCLSFDMFKGLETEHKRFKFLKDEDFLIQPESFYIGEIDDDKNLNGIKILTKKKILWSNNFYKTSSLSLLSITKCFSKNNSIY